MGLSMLDIMVGAVVDQAFGVNEDGKVYNRDTIRRGIITKVEGNGKDFVKAIHVKFRVDAEPEKVAGADLICVYKADSSQAREAYRRVIGQPRHVGAEFSTRASSARRKIVDSMAVTAKRGDGTVKPEYNEENYAGMELPDGAGPSSTEIVDPNLHAEEKAD